MRLDLRRNGIERIVSRVWGSLWRWRWWWGGAADPIKPPTCSAGKTVDQEVGAEEGLCFSGALVGFTQGQKSPRSQVACKSSEEERTSRGDQRLPGRRVERFLPHVSGISRGETGTSCEDGSRPRQRRPPPAEDTHLLFF